MSFEITLTHTDSDSVLVQAMADTIGTIGYHHRAMSSLRRELKGDTAHMANRINEGVNQVVAAQGILDYMWTQYESVLDSASYSDSCAVIARVGVSILADMAAEAKSIRNVNRRTESQLENPSQELLVQLAVSRREYHVMLVAHSMAQDIHIAICELLD